MDPNWASEEGGWKSKIYLILDTGVSSPYSKSDTNLCAIYNINTPFWGSISVQKLKILSNLE